ncbi:MAG: tyrosine-type recombinase/integrase [Terriglobales bacterium]
MTKHPRGIFERPKGSGLWWVRYSDASGRERREKVGAKGMALKLYQKRKTEAMQGKKLPETIRRRTVLFCELCEAAVVYARAHHLSEKATDYRAALLLQLFGERPAEAITPQEIERELGRAAGEREWRPASFNRYKAFVSLAYRLGIENDKVQANPARLVRRRREDNARVRWLTAEEESRLRSTIAEHCPAELPAFDLALHTGMRRSEQYRLTWDCVDFERRQLTIARSKHGGIRYIPLDATAMAALRALSARGGGTGAVMVAAKGGHGYTQGHALKTPKEWFGAACLRAGVPDFTWHCLRHTFASRLTMTGVGLRDVQELMGHKTIAMTCRYSHLGPSHQLASVCRLDGWGREEVAPAIPTGTRTGTGFVGDQAAEPTSSVQTVVQ